MHDVLNFDDTHIYLGNTRPTEDDGEELHSIGEEIKDFAKLFSLNYCSTTHKSQGETITEDFTIYDWNMISKKCRYTALSRAKNQNKYHLAMYVFHLNRILIEKPLRRKLEAI